MRHTTGRRFFLSLLMALVLLAMAAAPARADWPLLAVFEGPGDQQVNDSIALPDGSLVLVGSNSQSAGEGAESGTKGWAAHVGADGEVLWTSEHAAEGGMKHRFESISLLDSGDYLVVYFYFTGEETLMELAPLSADGKIGATVPLGGTPDVYGVFPARDGVYLLSPNHDDQGNTRLTRVDASGAMVREVEWMSSVYGGLITKPMGDHTLLVGSIATDAEPLGRARAAMLDAEDNFLWQDIIAVDGDALFVDGVSTPDGGLLVVGWRWKELTGATNLMHGLAARYDAQGNRLWLREYAYDDFGVAWQSIVADGDTYYVVGDVYYTGTAAYHVAQLGDDGAVVEEWTLTCDDDDIDWVYPDRMHLTDAGLIISTTVSRSAMMDETGLFDIHLLRADKP